MIIKSTESTARIESATLSVKDAAIYIGIGRNAMYGLINSGQIPFVKLSRTIRIPKAGLADWLMAEAQKHQLTTAGKNSLLFKPAEVKNSKTVTS